MTNIPIGTPSGQYFPADEIDTVCPNCGYCPHCGHTKHNPYQYPYYVPPYPYQQPVFTTCGTS